MDISNLFCEKHHMDDAASSSSMKFDTNFSQEDIIKLVFEKILSNPIFSGGFVLSIAGFLWYILDWMWKFGEKLFRERYFTSLELTNENLTYRWVVDHINRSSKWETRNLSVDTKLNENETGNARLTHKFIPGLGSHYFYYKNRIIYFERTRDKRDITIKDEQGRYTNKRMETVTLSCFYGSPEFWREFLDEASKQCLEAMDKGLLVHTSKSDYWEEANEPRRKRPLNTVILADGVSEKVCLDLKAFLSCAEWYHARGIPYRRGYLLYGPPGTGKSSFIAALASHFNYGIAILSLTNKFLSDSELLSLMNDAPSKCFIILEDIDVAFKNREKEKSVTDEENKNTVDSSITLSGLLNAIDGIASSEERIVFMTTNYKEHLDSALIRPGRVDFQIHLGLCTPEMTAKMFRRFYDDVTEDLVKEFVEATVSSEKSFSPAELQKHLIVHKDDPKTAIQNINDLC